MFKLSFGQKKGPKTILCLGAHSDDIEIGCGGTVLKLLEEYKDISFYWVVLSANGVRDREARKSAQDFLASAKTRRVIIKGFRDGFFPYVGGDIKEFFEGLKRSVDPDLIFTHYRSDLHQDHRLVSELTWNTFRDHLILEYEIPKYDGDLGAPNVFVGLREDLIQKKIEKILTNFKSQTGNDWFTEDTFVALLRLRGIESGSTSRHAEAFHGRKLVMV